MNCLESNENGGTNNRYTYTHKDIYIKRHSTKYDQFSTLRCIRLIKSAGNWSSEKCSSFQPWYFLCGINMRALHIKSIYHTALFRAIEQRNK